MRTFTITFEECGYSLVEAKEICPFDGFVVELHDGYIFFESSQDYETFCNQK